MVAASLLGKDNNMINKKIKFDERYDKAESNTTTLYFTAPKDILSNLYPNDYSEAISAEISIEVPTNDMRTENARVSISPTMYIEEEDAYTDYDWTDIELPLSEIEELIELVLKDERIEKLWEEFEDVTCIEAKDFYEDDEDYKDDISLVINSDWQKFEAGTSVEAIWRWFNANHSKGLQWLMKGKE